jgi:hypothetical protein
VCSNSTITILIHFVHIFYHAVTCVCGQNHAHFYIVNANLTDPLSDLNRSNFIFGSDWA